MIPHGIMQEHEEKQILIAKYLALYEGLKNMSKCYHTIGKLYGICDDNFEKCENELCICNRKLLEQTKYNA